MASDEQRARDIRHAAPLYDAHPDSIVCRVFADGCERGRAESAATIAALRAELERASELTGRLRDDLRALAIHESVATEHMRCDWCRHEWRLGEPESHAPDCPAKGSSR